MKLSQFLDADWDRLQLLCGQTPKPRTIASIFHPRFGPVAVLRCAHALHVSGWTRLAKLVSLFNVIVFGLEVPASLAIGPGLIIAHTNGIVLGASSIGKNVTIFHQVTVGALEADFSYSSARPLIEDNVTLAAGAKVLGSIVVGFDSTVGANAVVLVDVPPAHLAVGVPARIIPKLPERAA